MFFHGNYQVTRHMCPRNCYDACPMLAFTRGGKIEYLTGEGENSTFNRLCSKREEILSTVYHPRRLLYPQIQHGRGSGNWQQISWEEAIDTIARKILSIKERYHSTLPLCLNKYSGNFGLLHYSVEGMFNSLGPTTQTIGSPCFSAGLDAQKLDFGDNITCDIRLLREARLIILWGVNPAWTSIHTMPMIYAAKEHGAKIVVIDPVYTETACKADYYFELRPGGDAALAVLLLQKLAQNNQLTYDRRQVTGADELLTAVQKVPADRLRKAAGMSDKAVSFLADLLAQNHPTHIWCGYGLQRHVQSGLAIRLIDALAFLTGNIGLPGGGVNFADMGLTDTIPFHLMQERPDTRFISINNFAESLRKMQTPPIKFLWLAGRNLLRQDVGLNELNKLWSQLEFVVVADKFMTHSAQMADILLPVTTEFEELDIVGSYFTQRMGINEPAIPPRGEAKSDIAIARLLTRRLNELAPGTSTFPAHLSDEEFITAEFTPDICEKLRINKWQDLYQGPVHYRQPLLSPWRDGKFATADGKFHCCQLPHEFSQQLPSAEYPFHLLTPHAQGYINSQSHPLLPNLPEYPQVDIHPAVGKKLRLQDKHPAILWNEEGSIRVTVNFREDLAADIIVSTQGASINGGLNMLIKGLSTDLGELVTSAPGAAFYDVFVNIRPK